MSDLTTALADPEHQWTTDEIAELIATAFRWGYERRVDEENASYPPPKVISFGRWYDQAAERQRADDEVRALLGRAA